MSGIGGAVVGAGASYFASSRLAKLASDEVLERDNAARVDQDKRASHQVFVKLHAITNSLGSFQKQTLEMVAKADSNGNSHMPLYQRLSPFAGIEREPSIEFSAEELAVYIGAKRTDYVDDLLLLSRRYAACPASLDTFAKPLPNSRQICILRWRASAKRRGILRRAFRPLACICRGRLKTTSS